MRQDVDRWMKGDKRVKKVFEENNTVVRVSTAKKTKRKDEKINMSL